MLETLNRYIDAGGPDGEHPNPSSPLLHERRFRRVLAFSLIGHVVFYAGILTLSYGTHNRWKPRAAPRVELVKLVDVAPPPRVELRTMPEAVERVDLDRLEFNAETAHDLNLISRSPNPGQGRASVASPSRSTPADRESSASAVGTEQSNPSVARQPQPPLTPPVTVDRGPRANLPPLAAPEGANRIKSPPAPAAEESTRRPSAITLDPPDASPAREGSGSQALGLQALHGQYLAYVRAKIRKVNERIMPRSWIEEVLNGEVSADYQVSVVRDGSIASARLVRSSGYSQLDAVARQAIVIASPFEGFPQNAGNRIDFTVTVYYFSIR